MRQQQSSQYSRAKEEEVVEPEDVVIAPTKPEPPSILHYVETKVEGMVGSSRNVNQFGFNGNNTPGSRDPMAQTLTKTFRMPVVGPNAVIGTNKIQQPRGTTTPIDSYDGRNHTGTQDKGFGSSSMNSSGNASGIAETYFEELVRQQNSIFQ